MKTAILVASLIEANVHRRPSSTDDSNATNETKEQLAWAAFPTTHRVRVLRGARHHLASLTRSFAEAISPQLARTPADTRVAEVLPLLAACRFLEDRAEELLSVRKLGRRGLPFWLAGVSSEIHRVPLGRVLVIGPSNYPLFLPGVQVLQALVAGNAVAWKPGLGGRPVAELFSQAMTRAGLPNGLLRITDDTIEATTTALNELPAKVFFTGSAETGRILMRRLAETLTPCVMELSGCDAVIVLPSANLSHVVQALTFGMRLNGSATCMAPRRVLLVDMTPARRAKFLEQLQDALAQVAPIEISGSTSKQLRQLLQEAELGGAQSSADITTVTAKMSPVVVLDVRPDMRLAQADLFAPVLSIMEVAGEAGVLAAQEACPFALTASIFGEEKDARRLAVKLVAGTILINDIIVPTADPRLPFGGRRRSGFGVTRGAEGLLEMTAIKTIAVRRGKTRRHYEATTTAHEGLFDGIITASHSISMAERLKGLEQAAVAGKLLASSKGIEDLHGK